MNFHAQTLVYSCHICISIPSRGHNIILKGHEQILRGGALLLCSFTLGGLRTTTNIQAKHIKPIPSDVYRLYLL